MIIKANELRIGNWLFYGEPSPEHGKHYIDVYTISKTGINGTVERDADMDAEGIDYTPGFYEWEFKDLHPIPLTPEIFEAAEFKKGAPGYYFRDILIVSESGEVSISKSEDDEIVLDRKVTTLHELQNLYWCLYGEELKVFLTEYEPK